MMMIIGKGFDVNTEITKHLKQAIELLQQAEAPRPLFVYVEWSESNNFKDIDILSFKEFERIALSTALDYKDGGYLKTKIRVLFSTGQEYACRIDLAEHDTHGFRHHCDTSNKEYLGVAAWEFIQSIEWGE